MRFSVMDLVNSAHLAFKAPIFITGKRYTRDGTDYTNPITIAVTMKIAITITVSIKMAIMIMISVAGNHDYNYTCSITITVIRIKTDHFRHVYFNTHN